MAIHLTPRTEAMIDEMVATGHFADATDVIERAIRLLNDREQQERLRLSVAEGLAAVERGEGRELTSELWDEIARSAKEADRLGLPIKLDVQNLSSPEAAVPTGPS